ncbi:hypothetical protein [Kangiella shandongensis]|uniref:hypothetical protein n=1 Tax=Kangiella shandongensis TaxID=2763258 RepID=UPI001CBAB6C7|nr:hypothetical protein [Kangiella shandongensis]
MKKIVGLLLVVLLLVGLARLLMNDGTTEVPAKDATKTPVRVKGEITMEAIKEEERAEKEAVQMNIEEKQIEDKIASSEQNSEQSGLDIHISGEELEVSYQSESVADYGWKSYWENELYILLMDSTRTYPFVEQDTVCKSKTCKIQVTVAAEQRQYLVQALGSLNKEFGKRNMSVGIKSIDVKNGVIDLFVQPGSMPDSL